MLTPIAADPEIARTCLSHSQLPDAAEAWPKSACSNHPFISNIQLPLTGFTTGRAFGLNLRAREETFGPFAPVFKLHTEKEAIDAAAVGKSEEDPHYFPLRLAVGELRGFDEHSRKHLLRRIVGREVAALALSLEIRGSSVALNQPANSTVVVAGIHPVGQAGAACGAALHVARSPGRGNITGRKPWAEPPQP